MCIAYLLHVHVAGMSLAARMGEGVEFTEIDTFDDDGDDDDDDDDGDDDDDDDDDEEEEGSRKNSYNNNSDKIYLTLKGVEQFKAEHIEKQTNVYQVMNPELVICNMNTNVNLEVELTISKGRGYVPADENKLKDAPAGYIAIDSIYTPVRNVKYSLEPFRVEQRVDFEKLVLDIVTDGTIHPEDAVKEASRILIQHLMLITDENITFDTPTTVENEIVDEGLLHLRKLLKTPLEDMDLSVRAFNCLKAAKINSLEELVSFNTNDLLKFNISK
jgi:DNA-directed RNA polymerase subunit alpha